VPAYLIALPTRGLAIRTTTAFLLLSPLLVFLSILALYFLINAVTHDRITSAVGAICVLCFGTIVAGEGFLGHLLGRPSDFHGLFFLRRYLPAVPFPLFFLFCTLTWRSFTIKSSRLYSIGAGAVLVMLIFSYWLLVDGCFRMGLLVYTDLDGSPSTTAFVRS
jgi:hypothetical protein